MRDPVGMFAIVVVVAHFLWAHLKSHDVQLLRKIDKW